ncbi:hypothetical protein [Fructobacillus cardui]|uniref:Uncharacterized protein n=1 Tax=Fructobacillus cardui TaxID=2893170 RepID=A0ABN9YZ04_9LACO|nr:hypothetical protein [uncultured Fructobacillus sp.]CAK1239788.1 unnamed protein product [Fructobacillus cardui]CAK1253827.1 unnamed protein product [Fructobacillus cardui]
MQTLVMHYRRTFATFFVAVLEFFFVFIGSLISPGEPISYWVSLYLGLAVITVLSMLVDWGVKKCRKK